MAVRYSNINLRSNEQLSLTMIIFKYLTAMLKNETLETILPKLNYKLKW